jgi:hypothetical protein
MVVVVAGSVAALVNDRQDRLEDALLNVMGKQKTKWEVVDMEKELHNLWLDGFFPERFAFSLACSDCRVTNYSYLWFCVICSCIMALLGELDGAAVEPVAETPPVTLTDFIASLQLTDDPEDVALMMEACQVNRIRVSRFSLFRECCAMILLAERTRVGRNVEA